MEKNEKKEKKEQKFNGERIARQAEKSLKLVFPKAKFFAASKERPVEIVALDVNGYSASELGMFRQVFCTLSKLDPADLIFSLAKREIAPAAAPAAGVSK
jgi:hypothetical protein